MIELNKIYNEHCLDTMKRIGNKEVDLILTDPPYGINLKYDDYDDTVENWKNMMIDVIPEMIRISKMVIFPSCQIKFMKWYYDNFPPDWLISWYKGSTGHQSFIGFNDWEPHLVYGKITNQMYVHDFFQTKSSPKKGEFGHPCPKPVEWADWLISRISNKKTIIVYDPFMGSGTVGVSAKKHNCKYIGSDISKNYCQIAETRINNTKILNSNNFF